MPKEPLCIVGTGKVAQALIKNLKDHYLIHISSPSEDRAKELAEKYAINYIPYRGPLPCHRVIIVRRDSDIEKTSEELIRFAPFTSHIHMSGMLSSQVLKSEKKCSMHPIMSITPDTSFKGVLFAVEGNIDICTDIIETLGGKYFEIETEKKALYHTALVFISNFTALNTLMGLALLREVGKLPPEIIESVRNLAYRSIDNVLKHGKDGLTGPAARGDLETIDIESSLLEGFLRELYILQSDVIYKLHSGGGDNSEKDDSSKI
ncbi:MAG: DUF2520 domain-containing protein [Dictyoglomi bacterium]|jgi:predicted short-subunit dehydrogenase-like oxidoreductase (DUF2520 family)|nr:DUF2520 domain-containing protein [Dictyoglomota bacterium]